MVIHCTDPEIVLKFGLEKPAFRVLVNTQAALGAVGYTNELLPSMTLGPGTFGGSIISDNVSAKHLINVKRLAFETRPINPPEKFGGAPTGMTRKTELPAATIHRIAPTEAPHSWMAEIEERIRLKAGNVVQKAGVSSQDSGARSQKPEDGEKESSEVKKGALFGSGLTEAEVERLMKQFQK